MASSELQARPSSYLPSAFERGISRLRIRTIVRIRWIAVAGQTAAVLGVYWGLGFDLPIGLCLLAISASAWLNIFLRARYAVTEHIPSTLAAVMLGYDVLQLSMLLYLTGGLQNPFALLVIAPVTVSAYTQPPRTTLALGLLAILCVSLLTTIHRPLPWYPGETLTLPLLYVGGVWAALVSGAAFFALYAWRIAKETLQMADALAVTETALHNEQKISALDGLAAAAAHELGTPLGTISVVTKELLREVSEDDPLHEDITLLRSQAERCRDILSQLTRTPGEADILHSQLRLTDLLEEVVQPSLSSGTEIVIEAAPAAEDAEATEPVTVRNPGVIYGLCNLVENAVDFADGKVVINASWDEENVSVTIVDDGPGFSSAVIERLGEPYISSRSITDGGQEQGDERSGLGLGFFIAKTLLERSGARLNFRNRLMPHSGAIVSVFWPRTSIEASAEMGTG